MIPIKIKCNQCGATIHINSYRKSVICPYCDSCFDFEGFDYLDIDLSSSMYAHIEFLQDCPVCRSTNMLLGPSNKIWRCVDCGYKISNAEKLSSVFWFCDKCETFMNIQHGFNTKKGKWTCTECNFVNSTTEKDVW